MNQPQPPAPVPPPPDPGVRWVKIALVCAIFVILLVCGKALDDHVINAPDAPVSSHGR